MESEATFPGDRMMDLQCGDGQYQGGGSQDRANGWASKACGHYQSLGCSWQGPSGLSCAEQDADSRKEPQPARCNHDHAKFSRKQQ